jgi:hypothetical protein
MPNRYRLAAIAALAALTVPSVSLAQTLGLPPSVAEPSREQAQPAKKPAKPRAARKPASDDGAAKEARPRSAEPRASQAQQPMRVNPADIADPYGGVGSGSGVRPTMTPSGRPGVGGRF